MNDTSVEAKQAQKKFYSGLSDNERWDHVFEMIENGRATVLMALKKKYPDDSNTVLFIKMVKTIYKNDLSEEFLADFEKEVLSREKRNIVSVTNE